MPIDDFRVLGDEPEERAAERPSTGSAKATEADKPDGEAVGLVALLTALSSTSKKAKSQLCLLPLVELSPRHCGFLCQREGFRFFGRCFLPRGFDL